MEDGHSAILYQLWTKAILISFRAICGSPRAFAVVVIMWRLRRGHPWCDADKVCFYIHALVDDVLTETSDTVLDTVTE